jgi:uncharacterized protein YeaO (DUF488 family)
LNPDPWAAFAEVFSEELAASTSLTVEQMDELADAYQREQIASAQSEAEQEALHKEYSRG